MMPLARGRAGGGMLADCVAFVAYDNAQAGIVAVPAHGALRNAGVYECMCVVCGAYDRRPHARYYDVEGLAWGVAGTMIDVLQPVSCAMCATLRVLWTRCSPRG